METSSHTIFPLHAQLPPERKRLKSERKHLQDELDRLREALERSDRTDSPEVFRAALAQNARTTKGDRDVIETIGRVRMMQLSIEANRANMVASRAALGDGPGLSALDLRLQRADQEIQQIRADIDDCEPLLQAVRYACELHRTQQMTVMSNTEKGHSVSGRMSEKRPTSGNLCSGPGLRPGE